MFIAAPGDAKNKRLGENSPHSQKSFDSKGFSLEGLTILVAEDELFIALDLEAAIEDLGGNAIGPIYTVRAGLAFLDSPEMPTHIDAAILDIDLHGQEVFPVAAVLHQRGIPFVFHTANGRRDEISERWPGAPVCEKPVNPSVLMGVVADLAGR